MTVPDNLLIRLLHPDDKPGKFSLGSQEFQPLKTFLKRDAHAHDKANISKTFVLVEGEEPVNRIFGYVTLVCSEIANANDTRLDDCEQANRYPTFPAVKLARLAIHKDLQGYGLGQQMLWWTVAHIMQNVVPHAGCRFLVVDAKKGAVKFYEKAGFTLLDTPDNIHADSSVMFIDLQKLMS
ncbi:MAG: GNAT family N-acetyltransferase [Thiothrix sp.]